MTYDALLPELSHNIDMSYSCNNAHFSGKKAKVLFFSVRKSEYFVSMCSIEHATSYTLRKERKRKNCAPISNANPFEPTKHQTSVR